MKVIHAVRQAGAALFVVASMQVYAQANDAAPAANPTSQDATSHALGRSVRSALAREMGISASHVIVRSANGVVTLQGAVPRPADSEKAERIARGVPGVVSVKNALTLHLEGT